MFSKKIRHQRKLHKLTLKQLASAIGTSVSYICQLENKVSANPSAKIVYAIAKFFGCSVEYFMEDKYNIGTYPDSDKV